MKLPAVFVTVMSSMRSVNPLAIDTVWLFEPLHVIVPTPAVQVSPPAPVSAKVTLPWKIHEPVLSMSKD